MKGKMNNHLLAATPASWKKETSPSHLPTEAAAMPKQKCYRGNLREHPTGKQQEGCLPPLHSSWTIVHCGTVQKTAHQVHEVWETPVFMVDVWPPTQQYTLEYRTTKDCSVSYSHCNCTMSSRAKLQHRRLWKSSVGLCQKETKLLHISNTAFMFKKQNVK
jgi:hypothetical protein